MSMEDNGTITIKNLTDPGVLERRLRSERLQTKDVIVDDSFRNLVWMYQDELSAIRDGGLTSDHFSESMRRGMSRKGVLVKTHSNSGGPRSVLSEEASQVLDEVLAEEN